MHAMKHVCKMSQEMRSDPVLCNAWTSVDVQLDCRAFKHSAFHPSNHDCGIHIHGGFQYSQKDFLRMCADNIS